MGTNVAGLELIITTLDDPGPNAKNRSERPELKEYFILYRRCGE